MKSSMRFDLVDLRLFLMVVEAASITHGAARAGMAAQAMRPSIRPRDDVSRSRRTFLPILRRPRFVPLSPPASLGLALLAGSLPARGAVSIQRMTSTCADCAFGPPPAPCRNAMFVFRHRGGTPPINWLKTLSCLADLRRGRGPDRCRLGPRPCSNSERIINRIGQDSLGSRFGAVSQQPNWVGPMAEMVKGFGCRPVVTYPRVMRAGVRKPPRKEPRPEPIG
jgi:hypothetical protein